MYLPDALGSVVISSQNIISALTSPSNNLARSPSTSYYVSTVLPGILADLNFVLVNYKEAFFEVLTSQITDFERKFNNLVANDFYLLLSLYCLIIAGILGSMTFMIGVFSKANRQIAETMKMFSRLSEETIKHLLSNCSEFDSNYLKEKKLIFSSGLMSSYYHIKDEYMTDEEFADEALLRAKISTSPTPVSKFARQMKLNSKKNIEVRNSSLNNTDKNDSHKLVSLSDQKKVSFSQLVSQQEDQAPPHRRELFSHSNQPNNQNISFEAIDLNRLDNSFGAGKDYTNSLVKKDSERVSLIVNKGKDGSKKSFVGDQFDEQAADRQIHYNKKYLAEPLKRFAICLLLWSPLAIYSLVRDINSYQEYHLLQCHLLSNVNLLSSTKHLFALTYEEISGRSSSSSQGQTDLLTKMRSAGVYQPNQNCVTTGGSFSGKLSSYCKTFDIAYRQTLCNFEIYEKPVLNPTNGEEMTASKYCIDSSLLSSGIEISLFGLIDQCRNFTTTIATSSNLQASRLELLLNSQDIIDSEQLFLVLGVLHQKIMAGLVTKVKEAKSKTTVEEYLIFASICILLAVSFVVAYRYVSKVNEAIWYVKGIVCILMPVQAMIEDDVLYSAVLKGD